MDKKGIAFSVIPIIALLSILSLSIWSAYQLSIGSKYTQTYSEINKPDTSSFKIETIKNLLRQSLIYSSTQSFLEVAERGGTSYPITYWYCNKMANPPEIEEVNSALSKSSLGHLKNYIENSKEEGKLFEMKDVQIKDYTCAGIYDPGRSSCDTSSSSECEYFWTTATGENTIEVYEPTYMSEKDDIIGMVEKTRFYWIYYRMYKNTLDNPLTKEIQTEILDVCLEDFDISNVEQILEEACQRYERLFDEYVECSWEIPCFSIGRDCINSDCTRGSVDDEICYPEASAVDEKKVSFQGWEGSLSFKIKLVDNKYLITTNRKELVPLTWNIWGMIVFTPPNICYPTTTVSTTTILTPTTIVTPTTTTTQPSETTTTVKMTTTTRIVTTTTRPPVPDLPDSK